MKLIDVKGSDRPAIVDDEDYEIFSRYSWSLDNRGYVQGMTSKRMHQAIMNAPKGKIIDHINRDKLDNRRGNLRLVDYSENNRNRTIKNNSSGVTGVNWDKTDNAWRAAITINKTTMNVCRTTSLVRAIVARQWAESQIKELFSLYGETTTERARAVLGK